MEGGTWNARLRHLGSVQQQKEATGVLDPGGDLLGMGFGKATLVRVKWLGGCESEVEVGG